MIQKPLLKVVNMVELSNHTLLINQVIGLCHRVYGWPSTLKDLGYALDYIEPVFLNSEGKNIYPDLSITSNKLIHTIVVDCKSNTLKDEQLRNYSKLTVDGLKKKTSVYDPNQLTFDFCIVTNSKKHNALLQKINSIKKWPILFFHEDKIIKKNNFEKEDLDNAFARPITITGNPPTHYYPFSDNDDLATISLYVFQQLVVNALNKKNIPIDPDKLLAEIHPCWKNIHESKKKSLRQKVAGVLDQYSKKALNKYLEKVKGTSTWRITKPLDAFAKECNQIIENLNKQTTLRDES